MCNGQWRAAVAAHFRLRCGAANAVNCKFKTIFITAQTFHTLFCLPPEKICVVIAVPTFVNSPTGPNHQPQSKGMRRPQTGAGLAAKEKLGQDWQRGKNWGRTGGEEKTGRGGGAHNKGGRGGVI